MYPGPTRSTARSGRGPSAGGTARAPGPSLHSTDAAAAAACPPTPSASSGPGSTTCATSRCASRATTSSSSRACRAAASRASRSTPSTPRASGATSRACRPTRASSSARWTSRTSTTSTGCRRRSRSTRRPPAATRARRSRPSPRSTTTCACCYARVGEPHCPICGRPITGQSVEQITDQVLALPEGTRFLVLAPLVRDRKGEHRDVLEQIRAEGFSRVAVDGETYTLDEVPALDKKFAHTIEVVVDRLVMRDDLRRRLTDSLETATRLSDGLVRIEEAPRDGAEPRSWIYSERFACPEHGASLAELAPRTFSFNSPHGACPQCTGLGFTLEVDPELVVDPERTPRRGRDPALDRPHHRLLRPAARRRSPTSTRSTWTGRGGRCPSASARCCWRGPSGASACSSAGAARAAAGAGSRASSRSSAASTPPRCRRRCATASSSSCRCGRARPAAGRA